MTRLHELAVAHPRLTILIAATAVLLAAPGMLRLELRTDGNALVPRAAAEIRLDEAIRREFGLRDQLVVVVRRDEPDGVFTAGTLHLVAELTERIAALEGIDPDDVVSLATERGDRVRTGTLIFRRFLEPMPETPEELERLRGDLEAIDIYTGTLVSRDGRAAAIFVGVPPGADRPALHARIEAVVAALGDRPERIDVVGAPAAESLLGTHLLEDLRLLLPLVLLLMAGVFLVAFRRPAAALLPLLEVGACLLAVFGLMGWTGVPVYLTIAVMPVILTAIGIADEIHIFSAYRRLRLESPGSDRAGLVRATMQRMSGPVVRTSLTSAVAFSTFAVSPIGAVRAFGVFTAVGIGFCLLFSLTVIPACLLLLPPGWLVPAGGGGGRPRRSLFEAVALWAWRRRAVVLAAVGLLVLAAPLGVARVVVQDSWIDGFAPSSRFRQATEHVNEQFLGTHILRVLVDAGGKELTGEVPAGDVEHFTVRLPRGLVLEPETLVGQWIQLYAPGAPSFGIAPEGRARHRSPPALIESCRRTDEHLVVRTMTRYGTLLTRPWPEDSGTLAFRIGPRPLLSRDVFDLVCALEQFIAGQEQLQVGGVLGPCRYMATTNYIVKQRRMEEDRVVPDEPDRLLHRWQMYARVRGEDRLRETIDEAHGRGLVTVYMTGANFRDTARLMEEIRAFEARELAPHGVSLSFAGDVAVSQTLIGAIVSTQVRSLLLSLAGIVVVTGLLGRSLVWGVVCACPCSLAVLASFAVMGITGMPLGVATSMFSAMTLGVGIDYAIHLTERYRRALGEAQPAEAAMAAAARTTGPALAIDALAIVLGFGLLGLSQVPANARLGALVVLAVAGCFLATLVVVPAILSMPWPRRRAAGSASP